MRIVVAVLAVGCSKGPTVQCGAGTILNNGVCQAVAERAPSASRPDAAIVADAPIADAANVVHSWKYDSKTDSMRGATMENATIESTNTIVFHAPYGESHMTIFLRFEPPEGRDPGTTAILAIEGGQFDCGTRGCMIHQKLDGGKVEPLWAEEAAGGVTRALILRGPNEWIAKIKTTKHLVLEAPFYQDGERQFDFDVVGLKWEHGPKPIAPPSRWCFEYTLEPPEGQFIADLKKECRPTIAACEQRAKEVRISNATTTGSVTECKGR